MAVALESIANELAPYISPSSLDMNFARNNHPLYERLENTVSVMVYRWASAHFFDVTFSPGSGHELSTITSWPYRGIF